MKHRFSFSHLLPYFTSTNSKNEIMSRRKHLHNKFKGMVHTQSGCFLPKHQIVFDNSCTDFKLAGTEYFDFKHSY